MSALLCQTLVTDRCTVTDSVRGEAASAAEQVRTMAPKKTDFYERLGVAKDADETAIKKAYRTLALKHHPDKGGDPETFKLYAEVRATCFKPEDAPCGCCVLLTRWLRLAGVRCAVGRGETSRVRRHWRRRARRLRH